ncbi:hypothetical protein TL16_g03887 [Triparma laevis f. inornata]|uniref:Uncharacterized protein n=1 Tax=Triparma laevis f. inornata TaxID=1714386 RepID=A0A9W7E3P1_9STRA|nr:hypothetical protein TL16_g03887 [Triparma laevis f. inornata]
MDPTSFVCGECKPLTSASATPAKRRRKCVVIGLDGTRPDALLLSSTTFLLPLLRTKGVSYTFTSTIAGKLPVSYPSWAETFTGTLNHGIKNNTDQGPPKTRNLLWSVIGIGLRTAMYMSGWCGFRNVFGNDSSSGDTFRSYGATSDHEACSDSVDFCRVYGMEKDCDNDDLGAFEGDGELVDDFCGRIEGEEEVEDASVLYLYNCDRVGHRDGFGLSTESYITAVREMIDNRVSKIMKAVEAREARMNEEWLVIVCTDHGGTSRTDMEDCEGNFDGSDGGNAFGQGECEGVHGLGSIKQHRNTFLLIKVPGWVDRGGEIIVDEFGESAKVTNVDVDKTVKDWFGIANDDGLGVARGIGGRRTRVEGGCACCGNKLM